MNQLAKTLVLFGVLLIVGGAVIWVAGKIPWLGRLPGDFSVRRGGVSFYFPLTTCLLVSLLMTVLINLFWRR